MNSTLKFLNIFPTHFQQEIIKTNYFIETLLKEQEKENLIKEIFLKEIKISAFLIESMGEKLFH